MGVSNMECTLKELVAKLSTLLEQHPDATICSYDERLLVEVATTTHDGGPQATFEITSDCYDFFDGKDCLKVTSR